MVGTDAEHLPSRRLFCRSIQTALFIHGSFPVVWVGGLSHDHCTTPGPLRQFSTKPGTPSSLRQATFGVPTVNLKGLILLELDEGMTKNELASAIGVSPRTHENILADKFPEDPASRDTFARHFRMDVDALRTGGSTHSITILNLSESTQHSAAGDIRRIPLLNWQQMGQMVTSTYLPGVIHCEATVETTGVSGKRTVALKVKDDSMETMFSEGEIIFVDPDSKWKPGDYVIVHHPG